MPKTQNAAHHTRRKVLRAFAVSGVAMVTQQLQPPAGAQDAVRVPILCYHNIDYSGSAYATTPEMLDAECQWLINTGYTTISVYQLWNAFATGDSLPANPVMLTNDDGWSSSVTFAHTLSTYGLIGNYFINNYSPISADDIRVLAQNGPVQAHTANHQYMSQQDPATQSAEIANNQAYISEITGQPVQFLAWPFGDYSASAIQAAQDNGILAAFCLNGVPCYVGASNVYAIPRIILGPGDNLDSFAAKVNQW